MINNQLLILVFGRVMQMLIMLISIKVSTAFLSPLEMGNLYLIMSVSSFFLFFFINPIGQYINRKTHEWHHDGLLINKLFNYNYYILLASTISFFVVIELHFLGIAHNINYFLLLISIPLYVFFNTWNQTLIPMINMLEKRGVFTLLTILTLLLSFLLSCFMINFFEPKGIFWFLGQIGGLGIFAIVSFFYFIQKIEKKFSIEMAHFEIKRVNLMYIASFAFPLSIGVLFFWIQNQSYRIIIEKYIGAEFLGYFGVGMAVAMAISSSFETVVMQFLYPNMYKHMNDEIQFKKIFSNIINLIIPIYFLMAVFVSLMAIFLTTILVDTKYASSFVFVIFGIWIEFFRISTNLISNIAHSKMKTKKLILPYLVSGIFVIGGIYYVAQEQNYILLIPIVLMIGSFLTFLAMLFSMNKLVSIDFKYNRFFEKLPYSFVFFMALLWYDYSNNLYISMIIVILFGLYFLYVVHKFLKHQGAV